MRTQSLDALFPRTRQAVLGTLVVEPTREWYVRELAAHLRITPSSLPRELESLWKAGILTRRNEGRRAYFQADPSCALLPELQQLMTKARQKRREKHIKPRPAPSARTRRHRELH